MPDSVVSALSVAHFISFDDADDAFGDFKFATASPPPHNDDDDGWSDFFVGAAQSTAPTPPSSLSDPFPNASSSPDPISAPARPMGALPLSIFGEEEEAEEPQLAAGGFSSAFGRGEGKASGGLAAAGVVVGDLADLIKTLYGPPVVPDFGVAGDNAGGGGGGGGGDEGFDEESWEFQDAVSEIADAKVDFGGGGGGQNMSNGSYGEFVVSGNDSMLETEHSPGVENRGDSLQLSLRNGDMKVEEEEDSWEFRDALSDGGVVASSNELHVVVETSGTDEHSLSDVHQSETKNTFVDFYYKLKDGSTFLVDCYINDLREAQEAAALSGAHGMAKKINGKIEEAHKKLLEAKATDIGNLGKYPSKDVCISQMLEALVEPNLHIFEQEYSLSKRLLLAEKSLEGAIELLEHSALILHMLSLGSQEEQNSYVFAWSKIARICLHELQNGVIIWKEFINEGVSTEILSQEGQYFVALGEVYRIAEILRASVKFYKPWVLSNWGEAVKLVRNLDKCADVWLSSGLEKALESVACSNGVQHTDTFKALHASIKVVHDLDNFLLNIHSLYDEKTFCRLSLLPLATLQEMKMVIWDGEHYHVKLANLWANRISPDPPQLPCIHV